MSIRFPIAVALWTIAITLVAYRYGMLPFEWSSPVRHVLPGIAIGLAFGGRQLWKEARDAGAPRPGVPSLAGAGIAGAAVAFGICYLAFPTLGRVALTKRELPGFELSLPSGDIVQEQGDYTAGKLVLKHDGGTAVVALEWEPSTPLEPDDLQVMAKLAGGALGATGTVTTATVRGPDGAPVDSIAIDGDVPFRLSILRCGVRHVIVATIARRSVTTLHERIVASFACRADAAKDATARIDIPLHVDLPGWWVSEREPNQLTITNDHALVMIRPVQSSDAPVEKLLNQSFAIGGVQFELGARDGSRLSFKLAADDETAYGWAEMFACPRGSAVVMGLVPEPSGVDALYRRVKARARCLRDGEAPQPWPDAPPQHATPDASGSDDDATAPAAGSAAPDKP